CCWNCGRKASETCSGCNAARYCGSFCQHKDWERHHLICSPGLQTQPKSIAAPKPPAPPERPHRPPQRPPPRRTPADTETQRAEREP
ncbi:hypothetical protein M9458_014484, partial [Cirrhinus mrigala]